jgi:hypothetical protein
LKIWTLFVILVISIAIVIIINVWIGLAYMIMIWIAVHLICNHYELKRSKRELGKE